MDPCNSNMCCSRANCTNIKSHHTPEINKMLYISFFKEVNKAEEISAFL